MKKLVFLFLILCSVPSFAQTADDFFAEGKKAISKNNYAEAEGLLKKAAELGHSRACGYLANSYAWGNFPCGIDIDEAYKWGLEGLTRGDFFASCVLGEIEYYVNWKYNNKEAIELLETCYKLSPNIHIANILTAWYSYLGKSNKSQEWLDKAIAIKGSQENLFAYETDALFAKQAMDEGKYEVAIFHALKPADKYIPLALYVLGKSLILGRNDKSGKSYIKLAAEYEYKTIGDLISFKPEILNYWNEIKDKDYE